MNGITNMNHFQLGFLEEDSKVLSSYAENINVHFANKKVSASHFCVVVCKIFYYIHLINSVLTLDNLSRL